MEPPGRDQDRNKASSATTRASGSARSSGGTPTSLRWNPTKEQVDLLEALYRQGIRTPNADQIQQITARLRVFGHIEGKNVFYWFQNHKARQRQKQKQETASYINRRAVDLNRFFHVNTARPIFPSTGAPHLQYPFPNMVRGPCYVPMEGIVEATLRSLPQRNVQNEWPKKPSPSTTSAPKRSPGSEAVPDKRRIPPSSAETSGNRVPPSSFVLGKGKCIVQEWAGHQETLALFPLTPTGGLKGKEAVDGHVENSDVRDDPMSGIIPSGSTKCQASPPSSGLEGGRSGDKTFYDFL